MKTCTLADIGSHDQAPLLSRVRQTLWLVLMAAAALLSLHVMQQVHTRQARMPCTGSFKSGLKSGCEAHTGEQQS